MFYTFIAPTPAYAHVETWPYHSWLQETPGQVSWIKPLGAIASSWLSYYNSAVNAWNTDISDDPFLTMAWDQYAQVHVLVSGSIDESDLDWWMLNVYGFNYAYPCSYGDNGGVSWGTVAPYWSSYWDGPHNPHFHAYKVCIWTSRVQSGYQTLTIRHELGHILSLGDDCSCAQPPGDNDGALMRDGVGMTTPSTAELDVVRSHYNRW